MPGEVLVRLSIRGARDFRSTPRSNPPVHWEAAHPTKLPVLLLGCPEVLWAGLFATVQGHVTLIGLSGLSYPVDYTKRHNLIKERRLLIDVTTV